MCTGGGSPPQDTANQEKYAEMNDWLYQDWETRFKPIEESLLDELANKDKNIAKQADAAGQAAKTSYDATLGMSERNMARYGAELDEDQLAAQERSNTMAGQGAQISAQNMARDATSARYDQLQQNMVALGRGVQGTAISGMSSASGMETNRNAQNQQIYGQNQAAGWNALGTAAGLAGTAIMLSDKHAKKNIRKASTKKALKDIEAIELKRWDYKPGMSGGREEKGHIGGMAQDMPRGMTTQDRKQVDLGDSVMTLVGGMQALSTRLKRLEKDHG